MRKVFKILLLLCVIAGFVALTQAFKEQGEVLPEGRVTDVTISDGAIFF